MDPFETAEALLQQSGYAKFNTFEEYHDYEKWLSSDDVVKITLTTDSLAYSVQYSASIADGRPPLKHLDAHIIGRLADLTPAVIASIEAAFNRDEVLAKGEH